MSVSTDLTAIKMIADTTQERNTSTVLQQALKTLVDHVVWYEGKYSGDGNLCRQ
ncbi:hypothetical protein HUG15_08120 [Salicibibacter cibarius]|uniref:Uncharacterized protein n=1 Tax=Salicibibacter cibarius TaxID=2743000 RepID=A0A7T6Z376_9BACI|nr:hypothetical protein [Salicibibacter cibarius]QQK75551.1 hypothetical protein HUG15_08120 [Salicibibacter cibarius]